MMRRKTTPFADQDTIVYDRKTKTTSVKKAASTANGDNDPFASQDGVEKKNETGALGPIAGSVASSPSSSINPELTTSFSDLGNNFLQDDAGDFSSNIGGIKVDLRGNTPAVLPAETRQQKAQELKDRITSKTLTGEDAAYIAKATGLYPEEVGLAVNEPAKFKKYQEIGVKINNAQATLEDVDYLSKNFPAMPKG